MHIAVTRVFPPCVRLAIAAVFAWLAASGPASADVVDSINADKNPAATTWAATEVGWFYSPSFSYALDGIDTRFRTGDARIVTLEVYDAFPGSGGTLLRSAGFTPLGDVFSGASFAPLDLVAGQTYFIGFRNVGGLGVNVTTDPGATNLGVLRFSFSNDGSYSNSESGFTAQPILRFQSGVVPEPSSVALAGIGMLGLLAFARRRA